MSVDIIHTGRDNIVAKKNRSIAKIYFGKGKVRRDIYSKLHSIDVNGIYFQKVRYRLLRSLYDNSQIRELRKHSQKDFRKTSMISLVYAKLNPKGLTRKQYRHLRKGIELLGKHNILHGDLPDNVMLNKNTGMPIIIDFDEARLDSKNTSMDYNAFLSHYKVSK